MSKLAAAAVACVVAGVVAGCSAPAGTGAAPPSADEQHAVADATAMIPPAEAEASPGATASAEEAKPVAVRVPKAPYRTPLPRAQRAQ